MGGITALVQVILADLVGLREVGRYSGYLGAVFGLGTVSGPLLGGAITQAFGWRWCFIGMLPATAAVAWVSQRTRHLQQRPRRRVRIDFAGGTLFTAAATTLLLWLSLGGQRFAWTGWQTAVLIPLGLALLATALAVELRASEPLIPLRLFRERAVLRAAAAAVVLGAALFAIPVFGSQYLQLVRGCSALESALLILRW